MHESERRLVSALCPKSILSGSGPTQANQAFDPFVAREVAQVPGSYGTLPSAGEFISWPKCAFKLSASQTKLESTVYHGKKLIANNIDRFILFHEECGL